MISSNNWLKSHRNFLLAIRYLRQRSKSQVPFHESPSTSSDHESSSRANETVDAITMEESTTKRKALQVAVIGTPNVGKSAITNCLVKSEVCPVSRLIDTTRSNLLTSLTEEDFQLVVVDSPGLIRVEHAKKDIGVHPTASIITDPDKAVEKAEHIVVVYDCTHPGRYIHHRVMHMLHRNSHIPSSLVINKVDLLKDRSQLLHLTPTLTAGKVGGEAIALKPAHIGKLGVVNPKHLKGLREMRIHTKDENISLELQGLYRELMDKPTHKCNWSDTKRLFLNTLGWPNFDSVFYVSALTGEGIDGLRDHLSKLANTVNMWRYEEDIITNKNMHDLCIEHVRAALLDCLPGDIAYRLKVRIVEWMPPDDSSESLRIVTEVDCEKARWGKLVARRVQPDEVGQRLQSLFNQPVMFQVHIKHKGKLVIVEDEEFKSD